MKHVSCCLKFHDWLHRHCYQLTRLYAINNSFSKMCVILEQNQVIRVLLFHINWANHWFKKNEGKRSTKLSWINKIKWSDLWCFACVNINYSIIYRLQYYMFIAYLPYNILIRSKKINAFQCFFPFRRFVVFVISSELERERERKNTWPT